MRNLITIKTFEYPQESYIIKNKLESEGIYVFLKDELTIQTDNFLSNAIGGVKLQVQESDIENALVLLKLFEKKDVNKGEIQKEITLNKGDLIICPNCKSDNNRKTKNLEGIVGVILLFFAIPLPIYKKEHHCFECFNDFKVILKSSSK